MKGIYIMWYEKVYLEDCFVGLPRPQNKTCLTLYLPEISGEINADALYSCVVICPGGGYCRTSAREAEPVALRFLGNGIAAAVLHYSCDGAHYPLQLLQVLASITYIRRKRSKFHINPDKIAVMGFSAGGHAACSAGLFWQEEFVEKALEIKHGEDKPNGMILCYPVITSGEYAHADSFKCLLGENPEPGLLAKMSLENQVTENAPRTFLWHTATDMSVPVENSLLLAAALHKKGIPLEMHIYPDGHHGISLCDETVDRPENITGAARYCSGWFSLCTRWIKEIL